MVLDLCMPGTDGFEVLRRRRGHFPVIVYSATVDGPAWDSAVRLGAFDVLEKSCAPIRLLALVQHPASEIPGTNPYRVGRGGESLAMAAFHPFRAFRQTQVSDL
jgi:DNA-binding NtrC family response regulator